MNENNLKVEKISSLMIKFCVPAIIAMIITGMQSMLDGIFLGQFEDLYAMASVNIAQPFMQFIIGINMVICIGSMSLGARKIGANELDEAKNVFKTAFIILFIASIIILILGVIFNKQIALMLGASETLLKGSREYIFAIGLFAPFMSGMFLFGFTNRLLGKPNLYVIGTIISIVLNIILDYIFIKKLKMGVLGAGFATGLAFIGGFIAVCKPLLVKTNMLNVFVGKFKKSYILKMVYNGISEGVTAISTAITIVIFNYVFLKIAGDDGIVAFTALNYISIFATCVLFGMADGSTTIISFNYGAKENNRVKQALKIGIITNIIIGTIIFLLIYLFGNKIIPIFLKDNKELINFTVEGGKIYSLYFILAGFNILIASYFTALGKARESVIVASSRGLIFVILGIIILPILFGVNGIWITLFVAELVTIFICMKLLKNYKLQ